MHVMQCNAMQEWGRELLLITYLAPPYSPSHTFSLSSPLFTFSLSTCFFHQQIQLAHCTSACTTKKEEERKKNQQKYLSFSLSKK
jgi:hypothetical protein